MSTQVKPIGAMVIFNRLTQRYSPALVFAKAGGLAVTQLPEHSSLGFRITHVRSTWSLGDVHVANLADAVKAMKLLARMKGWNRSADALAFDRPLLLRASKVLQKFPLVPAWHVPAEDAA